jgi:protein TonB
MKIAEIKFTAMTLMVLFTMVFFMACGTPEKSLADKKNYTENDSQYRRNYDATFDENEKPIRYGYHYIVSSFPDGYKVRLFHPDKKVLTEERTYSTSSLTLLHGSYKNYWDDGSIRAFGTYQFGRKHGNWLECEPGKGKSSSGDYINQKKEGIWTQLDTNGMIESVYHWRDGKLHGKFFEYDAFGLKTNEGIYRNDTLLSQLFKKPDVQKPYLQICQGGNLSLIYACTEVTLIQKVNATLKDPSNARQKGIEGAVLVQWDIMPDGSVKNMRVPQGLSNEIETECLRVLSQVTDWVPASKEGIAIPWTMSIPINFRL